MIRFVILLFLCLMAIPSDAQMRPRCDEFTPFPFTFAQNLQLSYISKITDPATGNGTLTVQLTYSGLGWVGLGWSLNARMIPGDAVIGNPTEVRKWDMFSYSFDLSGLAPFAAVNQTLTDTSFVQNRTHSVLRFTKILLEPGHVPINGTGRNFFLWAYGANNLIGLHQGRGVRTTTLIPCDDTTPAPTFVAETFAPTTSTPSLTPSASSMPSDVASNMPSTSEPSASPSSNVTTVNCSEFQTSINIDDSLSMDYVVNVDANSSVNEGYLRARLTYRGRAWVALGVAPFGSLLMVPADAVIGMPGSSVAHNPGKYVMNDRNVPGVQLFPDNMQTLANTTLFQNDTHTIMEFTKRLVEPNEQPLDGNGTNHFLWAYGTGNNFIFHAAWGAIILDLRPCSETDGGTGEIIIIETETFQELWAAHGLLATLAWGVVSPLAIGASMLRAYLPPGKLWLQAHFYLNMAVLVLTAISFFIAVAAQQRGTPDGESPNHFQGLAHASVGLVVFIFCLLQVLGGIYRAPAPGKKEDGTPEDKEPIRVIWELGHKLVGAGLLGMAWWQVQDGLGLYSERYTGTDFLPAFWAVAIVLSIVILALYIYDKNCRTKAEPVVVTKEAGIEKGVDDNDEAEDVDGKEGGNGAAAGAAEDDADVK